MFPEGYRHDGRQYTGVEILCRELIMNFPGNDAAIMIRTGLELFPFAPRPSQTIWEVFARFDRQVAAADKYIGTQFTYKFNAWMLMSVFRLPAKKWSEFLKDNNRKMPSDLSSYQKLRDNLHREKLLEETLFQASHGGNRGQYAVLQDDYEPTPLFMCLGNPIADHECSSISSSSFAFPTSKGMEDVEYEAVLFSDDSSSDEEQWAHGGHDFANPWIADQLAHGRQCGQDPSYLADLHWQARKLIRRYQAAKGKFGPRRRFRPRISKRLSADAVKNFQRKATSKLNNRQKFVARRGFFLGPNFVNIDQVDGVDLGHYFKHRSVKKISPHQRCFKCRKLGHWAARCKSSIEFCHNCGNPGHRTAECAAAPKQHHVVVQDLPSANDNSY